VLAIVFPLRRLGKPAAWFSILCAAGAFASAVMAWRIQSVAAHPVHLVWPWLPSAGKTIADVGVLVDAQSTIMLCLVSLVALLVQFYSVGYLHDEPAPALGRYYAYQSLFAFSMMGLALAPNLLQLFMCWELVGLCSYLLIGFWYQRPSAARAAVKAFWITKAGDVGMLIGIVMLYRAAGTFDITELHSLAASNALPMAGLSVITFCLYLGAMGKSAQFPFHVWLPDAMEGPTPVSALIHAATMVTAGVYLLVRTDWLFALTPNVLLIVAWIGAFTALLAAVLACVQDDIKRVLAYSTVSQLGYMMTAIGAGVAGAGFLHLLTHGLFKALLFLGAGSVIHAVGSNDLPNMGGLAKRMPQTATSSSSGRSRSRAFRSSAGSVEGRNSGRRLWRASDGAVCAADAGCRPDGLLHVPRRLPGVLWNACARRVAAPVHVAHAAGSHGTPSRVAHAALHNEAVAEGAHVNEMPHAHEPPMTMLLPLWILAIGAMVVGVMSTLHLGGVSVAEPAKPRLDG
jgi:proton-translocating NADH-quinone oxidoreductase chain L